MSQDRLTRQELSWLLAQEARGAARALREGVQQLTHPPPPGPAVEIKGLDGPPAPAVETNLDALDEAIAKLGELQMGTRTAARRGRIDLGALVCEVMPNARIAMDTGSGTEVFGEEQELRRMIHLLVSQTNSSPVDSESARPDVEIKREAEWVKISVMLGPDSSATAELERRWLSRMATRHGGRLELEGGTETLFLPADRASDEMNELRRELEQAQQLGEAYARELAVAFAETARLPSEPRAASAPPPSGSGELELLVATATALTRTLRAWVDQARADVGEAAHALGVESELAERLTRRISSIQELFAELERVSATSVGEGERRLDLAAELRDLVAQAEPRAARHGVSIDVELPSVLELSTKGEIFSLIARALVDHAIAATPRGGRVAVRLVGVSPGFKLVVEDGGPAVPAGARQDMLRRRADPSALGRPEGLSLLIAEVGAPVLGATLSLGESSAGRSEVELLAV